jgi:hypothetical protein
MLLVCLSIRIAHCSHSYALFLFAVVFRSVCVCVILSRLVFVVLTEAVRGPWVPKNNMQIGILLQGDLAARSVIKPWRIAFVSRSAKYGPTLSPELVFALIWSSTDKLG